MGKTDKNGEDGQEEKTDKKRRRTRREDRQKGENEEEGKGKNVHTSERNVYSNEKIALRRRFAVYVFQNILGMIGVSAYVLADTFFISIAEGARGITALNLVLPVYSLIFAIGAMIGVGSAIRFRIGRARGEKDCDRYFPNALFYAALIGVLFMVVGIAGPDRLIMLLGGDEQILPVAVPYTRIFLLFSPFFMWNYVVPAFVRNDENPSLAMTATLFSSLFNILMDYILMFPCGLGMAGAAWATAFSPIVGILICSIHFLTKKNTIPVRFCKVAGMSTRSAQTDQTRQRDGSILREIANVADAAQIVKSCRFGFAAFVGEISSGVTTAVFNFLLLSVAGNIGVAAYGIIANVAIVATAVFNGVAQGMQPLVSEYYGKNHEEELKETRRMGILLAVFLAVCMIAATGGYATEIVSLFNSEGNPVLAGYASEGIRIYFIGFLFAGVNMIGTSYLGAVGRSGWASVVSLLRGFAAIILCAVVLAMVFGMRGIWFAFPAAEGVTFLVLLCAMGCIQRQQRRQI